MSKQRNRYKYFYEALELWFKKHDNLTKNQYEFSKSIVFETFFRGK